MTDNDYYVRKAAELAGWEFVWESMKPGDFTMTHNETENDYGVCPKCGDLLITVVPHEG